MRCIQVLSALALRRLLPSGRGPASGNGTDAVLTGQFPEESQHVARALRQANARAWIAIETLLEGEALWERAQLTWKRSLEEEFFRPVRRLLNTVSVAPVDDGGHSRRVAAQALQAALGSGLLTSGPLEIAELLPADEPAENNADSADAEWRALTHLADRLEQSGYPELRPLFYLRTDTGDAFLVVMVAALFRQAIEDDPDLFDGLAASCVTGTSDGAVESLRPLAVALDRHDARFDVLLRNQESVVVPPAAHAPPLDPVQGATRMQRGLACAQRGEYEQAVGEYTAALQFDPASAQAFTHRGDAHRHKGDYAQALADYGAALRLNPAGVVALIQRAQVHWTMGHVEEALADCNAALQVEPRNAVAYHYRGKALAERGDYDGAVVNFSEALRIDPFYTWAYHDSGEAYAAMGNFARAIADFGEAIRLNPLTTISYLRRGDAYAALQDFDRAIADYTNASRLDPQNPLAYQCLGMAYREQGKYDQAAAEFTKALEWDYSNGRLYFERGLLFQLQANHERALLDFNAAVGRNSADAEMCYRRGLSYQALGDSENALADLSRALRLNPQHAAAYHSRGLLYAGRNESDLALSDFNTALHLDPDLTGAYVNRAKILAQAGDLGQAAADCDEALARDPHGAAAYLVRGSVRAQQGAFPAAVDDFSQSLRLNPGNTQAFYLRALAHLKMADPSQAVRDLTEAIRLDPSHGRAYAQRAALRQAAGQPELALPDLAHAARLDVQFVPAYLRHLGLMHTAMEMYECAVADYTAALSLDPDNAAALAGRDRAWKAHLKRRRSRLGSAKVSLGSTRLPELPGEIAEFPQDQQADAASSDAGAARDTLVHQLGQKTGIDLPALDVADEAASPGMEDVLPEVGSADTSFILNIPEKTVAPDTGDASVVFDSPQTFTVTGVEQDGSLSIDALKDVAPPSPCEPQREPQSVPNVEEIKNRAQFEQAKRELLLADLRRAEEERKDREEKAAAAGRKAEKKAAKKRAAEDDDYVKPWPLWQKGAVIAAGVLLLYWVGSAASGFFADMRRNARPQTMPLAGKVVDGIGNQPLAKAHLRFHPKDGAGTAAFAATSDDGTFKVSTFTRDDGIVPGNYVVTIEASRSSTAFVPRTYQSVKTSPLEFEIRPGDETLPPIKLQP